MTEESPPSNSEDESSEITPDEIHWYVNNLLKGQQEGNSRKLRDLFKGSYRGRVINTLKEIDEKTPVLLLAAGFHADTPDKEECIDKTSILLNRAKIDPLKKFTVNIGQITSLVDMPELLLLNQQYQLLEQYLFSFNYDLSDRDKLLRSDNYRSNLTNEEALKFHMTDINVTQIYRSVLQDIEFFDNPCGLFDKMMNEDRRFEAAFNDLSHEQRLRKAGDCLLFEQEELAKRFEPEISTILRDPSKRQHPAFRTMLYARDA